MSILDEIVKKKKERLAGAKAKRNRGELMSAIKDMPAPLDFRRAIKRENGIRLIAELKKASPSRGLIRPDFDPARIAAIYKKWASALSVLTEEDFFQGSIEYLKTAKAEAQLPVLRKDFIFDEYQIYESRAEGADAILLIARLLAPSQAAEYMHLAGELGLGVLFEVHDYRELETALRIDAPIIGINNRNLETLQIDLQTTFNLKKELPAGKVAVSESGINTRADVLRLEEAGVDAMLVGTAFMKERDMEAKIRELMGAGDGKG